MILQTTQVREQFIVGVGNRCHDSTYIVFLDYDDTPLDWIREEIILLQKLYELGTAYLFKTGNGFHVVFLEKCTLGALIDILDATTIDKNFRDVPMKYGGKIWVLRQTEKDGETIKYIGPMFQQSKSIKSWAHKEYLRKTYKIPRNNFEITPELWDMQKQILHATYYVR